MKIEKAKTEFVPVTITLESYQDYRLLQAMAYHAINFAQKEGYFGDVRLCEKFLTDLKNAR